MGAGSVRIPYQQYPYTPWQCLTGVRTYSLHLPAGTPCFFDGHAVCAASRPDRGSDIYLRKGGPARGIFLPPVPLFFHNIYRFRWLQEKAVFRGFVVILLIGPFFKGVSRDTPLGADLLRSLLQERRA